MDPRTLALVAAGGAIGATARYIASVYLPQENFPVATLTVNTVGTFLLAAFLFHSVAAGAESLQLRAFFAIGLLGAFTTMSTFGVETLTLWTERHAGAALSYVGMTLALTLVAAIAGRAAALALTESSLGT